MSSQSISALQFIYALQSISASIYANTGRVLLTQSFLSAAGGDPKCCPTGAVLLGFHARRHFQNANGHTFAGKSRPVAAILHVHRPRLQNQHGFSVDAELLLPFL